MASLWRLHRLLHQYSLGISGYSAHKQYVNLFDSASNILLYRPSTTMDGRNEVSLPKALWTSEYEETWPAWSPDGKWLYFCRTDKSDKNLTQRYPSWNERVMHIYFDFCRSAFNPQTGRFADTVQVLLKSDTGQSYSLPRVHPDGKHILLCRGLFNSVPYHSSGNLLLIHIDSLFQKENPAEILNSEECESWHEWSANGRWVVFSSKRQDGHYATPHHTLLSLMENLLRSLLSYRNAAAVSIRPTCVLLICPPSMIWVGVASGLSRQL